MKNDLIIPLFFIIGVTAGFFINLPKFLYAESSSFYVLAGLILLIGILIGSDSKNIEIIKKLKLKVVLIPIATIIGSLLAIVLVALFLRNIDIKDSLAIGSGLGYYSLSAIIIEQIKGEYFGVLALLVNIFREVFTLLFAPLIKRIFGEIALISSGGATSMDVTLPIIVKYCGKKYAMLAVVNGTVLTILVPILVLFFLKL